MWLPMLETYNALMTFWTVLWLITGGIGLVMFMYLFAVLIVMGDKDGEKQGHEKDDIEKPATSAPKDLVMYLKKLPRDQDWGPEYTLLNFRGLMAQTLLEYAVGRKDYYLVARCCKMWGKSDETGMSFFLNDLQKTPSITGHCMAVIEQFIEYPYESTATTIAQLVAPYAV